MPDVIFPASQGKMELFRAEGVLASAAEAKRDSRTGTQLFC